MKIRKGLLGLAFIGAAACFSIKGSLEKIAAEEHYDQAASASWIMHEREVMRLEKIKELDESVWTAEQQKELDRAIFRRVENAQPESAERNEMKKNAENYHQIAQGLSFTGAGFIFNRKKA